MVERWPPARQPEWRERAIGDSSYGITLTDLYYASLSDSQKSLHPDYFEPVIVLETDSNRSPKGYWAYSQIHGQWYWNGGNAKAIHRQILEKFIKPNYGTGGQSTLGAF